MIETNLQEAIAKITLDESYREKLTQNPDQLLKEYGIKTLETLPTNDNSMLINKTIRPVSGCCTCAPA
jgi:hypothetical protein